MVFPLVFFSLPSTLQYNKIESKALPVTAKSLPHRGFQAQGSSYWKVQDMHRLVLSYHPLKQTFSSSDMTTLQTAFYFSDLEPMAISGIQDAKL